MKKFLRKLLIVLIVFTALFLTISALYPQYLTKYGAPYLKQFEYYITFINSVIFQKWVTGITFGTLILIFFLLLYPLFTRKIDTKAYFKNIIQGIIASFIFFMSQSIYNYFAEISKLYLFIAIFGGMIVSFFLIQFVAGMYKKEDASVEFRTANIASITAGLIFGILLQLISIGMDMLKIRFHSFHL